MRIEIKDKEEFLKMFNGIYENHKISKINGITIDSRKVEKNDIFIPIKGENFDGHKFISNSINNGAVACFSELERNDKINIIKTKSIKNEINILAKTWSKISKSKIIGITGSNGKTTAKNLLYHILKKKFNCNKTIGNYNSLIGFPISFLGSRLNDKYSILEYGASKPNEIKKLCDVISPDYSLITNISKAHIKNYESFKELINTKYAIYTSTKKNGTIFINTNQLDIKESIKNKKIISFNSNNTKIENNYLLINNKKIFLPENIIYLKDIILSTYIITNYLGIDNNQFEESLKSYSQPSGRGNFISYKDYKLIDDSYNANPNSVIFAINRLSKMKTDGKKIFVLGDMLELGTSEINEHNKLANSFNNSNIDIVLTYGNICKDIHNHLSEKKYSKHYFNKKKLKNELNNLICKNDLIYIKGSRSMKLENLFIKN